MESAKMDIQNLLTRTSDGDDNIVSATVQCHCKATSFPLRIPSASFPLKSAICHCTSCRRVTGELFTSFAVIPLELPSELSESPALKPYASSPGIKRYFCTTCGASVINVEQDEWEVATGCLVFDDADGLTGKLKRVQLWAEDVQADGGALPWINEGALAGMDRHIRERGSDTVTDDTVRAMKKSASVSQAASTLQATCHCGAVDFSITRPKISGGGDDGRFETVLCACTSCRVTAGFEITAWASVPHTCIERYPYAVLTASDTGSNGPLTLYQTSPKVWRWFCSGCGAKVFYQAERDTVDVNVGLLNGGEGVGLCGEWCDWGSHLHFTEDAVDKELAARLQSGMKTDLGQK